MFDWKKYFKSSSKKAKFYLIIHGIIFTYTSGLWTMIAHNIGLLIGLLIYLGFYNSNYKKLYN